MQVEASDDTAAIERKMAQLAAQKQVQVATAKAVASKEAELQQAKAQLAGQDAYNAIADAKRLAEARAEGLAAQALVERERTIATLRAKEEANKKVEAVRDKMDQQRDAQVSTAPWVHPPPTRAA